MDGSEFSRRNKFFSKRYALGLNLTPATVEEFLSQWKQATVVLSEWRARRGKKCETVMFTITAVKKIHPYIKEHIYEQYRETSDARTLLQALQVKIALLNEKGKTIEKIEFGPDK